jgi:hypothetical protein
MGFWCWVRTWKTPEKGAVFKNWGPVYFLRNFVILFSATYWETKYRNLVTFVDFSQNHFIFEFLFRFSFFCEISPVKTRGVSHTVALPSTLKSILRQKKNYENSNISPCQNIIFKKNPIKETKILQDIITLTNLKFQKFQHKPKYHLSKISYKNRPNT